MERVEPAGAIAPDDLVFSAKILHRKTIGIKLNRAMIISGKLTDIKKICNKIWSNQNIGKMKGMNRRRENVKPMEVIGSEDPLPTMTLAGWEVEGG